MGLGINRRRPYAANAARVGPVDAVTPTFASYLKVPDPEVGENYWQNGSASGYLWPPPQPNLALQYLTNMPRDTFVPSQAMNYIEERHRRMLEDNRRQIAEAEQRERGPPSRSG